MKFSHDGKFLATAGQDRMVYVWKVKAGRGDSPAVPSGEKAADQSRNGSSAGRNMSKNPYRQTKLHRDKASLHGILFTELLAARPI